jgi:hypothetical protein
MFKKMFQMTMAVVLVSVFTIPRGSAAAMCTSGSEEVVQYARSTCVLTTNVSLTISDNGVAKIIAGLTGRGATSNIEMKVILQKYNSKTSTWSNVKTWSSSSQSPVLSLSKNYSLTSKGTYRVKLTGTVYCNGESETVSNVSGSEKY